MQRVDRWLLTGLAIAGLGLAACGPSGSVVQAGTREAPAQVAPIPGTGVSRVTLTAQAAQRLGIQTKPAQAVPATAGAAMTSVPTAALIYDKNGKTWVYTTTQPLAYVRQAVEIARIDGDVTTLHSGPPPGTLVVTVGSAELLGAELGVAGE
jgi:hypothetical protein